MSDSIINLIPGARPVSLSYQVATPEGHVDIYLHVSYYDDEGDEPIVSATINDRRGLTGEARLSGRRRFEWTDWCAGRLRGEAAIFAAIDALREALPGILASKPEAEEEACRA